MRPSASSRSVRGSESASSETTAIIDPPRTIHSPRPREARSASSTAWQRTPSWARRDASSSRARRRPSAPRAATGPAPRRPAPRPTRPSALRHQPPRRTSVALPASRPSSAVRLRLRHLEASPAEPGVQLELARRRSVFSNRAARTGDAPPGDPAARGRPRGCPRSLSASSPTTCASHPPRRYARRELERVRRGGAPGRGPQGAPGGVEAAAEADRRRGAQACELGRAGQVAAGRLLDQHREAGRRRGGGGLDLRAASEGEHERVRRPAAIRSRQSAKAASGRGRRPGRRPRAGRRRARRSRRAQRSRPRRPA